MKQFIPILLLLLYVWPAEANHAPSACLDLDSMDAVLAAPMSQYMGCGTFVIGSSIFGTCTLTANFLDISQSPWVINVFPLLNGFCLGGSVEDNGSMATCSGSSVINYQYHFITYLNFGGNPIPFQYFNGAGYMATSTCCG
ncbi:MAG: hypothetical protein WD355_03140 [Balneolaceae bacterium]